MAGSTSKWRTAPPDQPRGAVTLALYRNHPYLQPRERDECLDYLTAFFTLLEQPEEDVLNSLGEACRKQ